MVFIKRVNNNDQGDLTHWGGDHTDTLDKYFDDVDIEGTTGKPAKINTKTEFRDNKLYLWNGANTFKYNIRPGTLTQNVELTLPTLSANGTLLSTGGANDWTALQTFRNTLLAMRNPANTASYIHNTSAIVANRNVTWPLLTADDTVAFNNFPAEFQGKTVNIDQNTLKHSTTNAEGDILIYDTASGRYIRLAGGTDGQILKRVSGDTAWTDDTPGGGGGGEFTVPVVGNTVVGAWYGTDTDIVGGAGAWANQLVNLTSGAVIGPLDNATDTAGRVGVTLTIDLTGETVGFRTKTPYVSRQTDPEMWVRYAILTPASNFRLYIGMVDDITNAFTSDSELNSKSGFMIYKNAADANITNTRNDGDATQDNDTAVNYVATNNNIHTIRLFAESANSRFGIQLDGGTITYYTTEIPASTTRMGCIVQMENTGATTKTFILYGAYLKYKII